MSSKELDDVRRQRRIDDMQAALEKAARTFSLKLREVCDSVGDFAVGEGVEASEFDRIWADRWIKAAKWFRDAGLVRIAKGVEIPKDQAGFRCALQLLGRAVEVADAQTGDSGQAMADDFERELAETIHALGGEGTDWGARRRDGPMDLRQFWSTDLIDHVKRRLRGVTDDACLRRLIAASNYLKRLPRSEGILFGPGEIVTLWGLKDVSSKDFREGSRWVEDRTTRSKSSRSPWKLPARRKEGNAASTTARKSGRFVDSAVPWTLQEVRQATAAWMVRLGMDEGVLEESRSPF